MTEEEIVNWNKFCLEANSRLDAFNRGSFLSFEVSPSFDKKERLFVSLEKDKTIWYYIVWDSVSDYNKVFYNVEDKIKLKLGKLIPSIKNTSGEFESNFHEKATKTLESLSLKPFVKLDSIGLDGTIYKIGIGDLYRKVEYSWWEKIPDEWVGLNPIIQTLEETIATARLNLN